MDFLLDLDDTLLDFSKAERENLRRTFSAFGLPFDDALCARFHEINDGLWKLLERGGILREELKVRRFHLFFEEFGLRADAEAVSRAYFEGFSEVCFPFPGAREFLETLAARGRIYIVTNGSTVIQRRHIADAGFSPYLAGAFISEEIGADKPSQAYADYVCTHIPGFQRTRAVWVGDSLTSDRACAELLGVPFILFARTAPQGYDGVVASDYGELISVLSRDFFC